MRPGHLPARLGAVQADDDSLAFAACAYAFRVQADLDALALQNFLYGVGNIFILARDQARALFDDGDVGAEAPIHLAKLQANVATADDDQMFRQKVHVHHARVGEIRYLIQSRHRRYQRAPADVNKYSLGLKRLTVHTHRASVLETRVAVIHRAVLEAPHPLFHTLVRASGNFVLACFHSFHVDADFAADRNAVVAGAPR